MERVQGFSSVGIPSLMSGAPNAGGCQMDGGGCLSRWKITSNSLSHSLNTEHLNNHV